MSGFAESFWTEDYATGLAKLFVKLKQGVIENEEVVTLARRRAEAEESHGNKLQQIARESYRKDGFVRDDGASVRRAFEGMMTETGETGKYHNKIATNLQSMVLKPFGRWTQEHALRVQTSEKELFSKVKARDKQAVEVKKLRSVYFNKCRLLEDFEEENKLAFPGPENPGTPTKSVKKTPEEIAADLSAVLDDEPVELGEAFYSSAQMKVLLEGLLNNIEIKEVRVPILGTFQHVSTGSAIVEWIHKNMGVDSLGSAEVIGQDLLNAGYLRYLGVGSTFANSSVLNYQWRDKALIAAGRMRAGASGIASRAAAVPYLGEYVSTYVTNDHANESPQERLNREATEANDAYKAAVRKLDSLRTNLEETIMEHLKFMERCELDRLKALKAVMMDISAALSNIIPGMKSAMDTMLLFQESISPLGDLKYMIESYRSGNFVPKVVTYENYYNSVDDQTFGVDLELRARQDKKRVPNIVATILSLMDELYPGFETDEARQKVWVRQVPLHLSHQLREAINNGKPVQKSVLEQFDPAIVASTLKLYLLELPDSLVFSALYEPIKAIYSNYGTDDAATGDRVAALSNVLQQMRVSNIATLDAITVHFARLSELTNADDQYKMVLASNLAPCILRPRSESSLTQQDKHQQRLFMDLLDHRDEIFASLKRVSTTRPRSATDEKDRRLRMEERNKAIQLAGRRPSSSGSSSLLHPHSPMPQSSLRHENVPVDMPKLPPAHAVPTSNNDRTAIHPNATLDTIETALSLSLSDANGQINDQSRATRTSEIPLQQSELFKPSHDSQGPAAVSSRPLASSNKLSRHSRHESRSLTGPSDSAAPQFSRASIELHDPPVARHSVTLTDNPVPSVHGISLEDGTVDYD